MKLKIFCITAFILLLVSNFYAIISSEYWLVHINNLLFLFFAMALFHKRYKKFNRNFLIFLGALGVSSFIRIFEEEWVFNEFSLILLTVAYLALIFEALQHTKVKNANSFMLAYFFLVVGANGYLLSMHVYEMREHVLFPPMPSSKGIFELFAFTTVFTTSCFSSLFKVATSPVVPKTTR